MNKYDVAKLVRDFLVVGFAGLMIYGAIRKTQITHSENKARAKLERILDINEDGKLSESEIKIFYDES